MRTRNIFTRESTIVDDVKHTIYELLEGIESGCSFATSGVFSEAPLPDIYLRGYGEIALPLTPRDMETICKERAEDDNGKRTHVATVMGDDNLSNIVARVGKSVPSQWEIKRGNLLVRNPAWNRFVQPIAVKAARDLGSKSDAGTVKAKLVRTRLWAADACVAPLKDTSNAVDCFAKLLICLPASHRGGHLLFAYGAETRESVTETSHPWSYSYIAWYNTDVSLELKPLHSGHMLMLEYDLALPSPAMFPYLVNIYSEKRKLRNLLATWNDAVSKESATEDGSFPTLLAHSQPLSLDVLQGNDRFRADYLRNVGAALDMGLFIADLDRTLDGYCDDHPDEDDDYLMDHEDEDSIVLTTIVHLDGTVVRGRSLDLDVEDNFVANDPFDDGPDSTDLYRIHGRVTYYYRRTVLVLIPSVAWLPVESPASRSNKRKSNVEVADLE